MILKVTHPTLDVPGPCRGNQGLELKHTTQLEKESGRDDKFM